MRYDLKQIQELCGQLGLRSSVVVEEPAECARVDLGGHAVLCFVNAEDDEDCLVGFKGTGWHFHDDFVFEDRDRRVEIRLNYLDLLRRIKNGQIVVLEHWTLGQLHSRELLHSDSEYVLHCITAVQAEEAGAEIRIWRAPRYGLDAT